MASQYSVSVIVPAYNAAGVLERSLQSVFAQTLPVQDVVVVDDGSTDDTALIAGRHGPRVRCIQQDNAGVAEARNRGIREATGQWVALLDADDEWFPDKISRQTELLKANPELKWCACGYDAIVDVAAAPHDNHHVPSGAGGRYSLFSAWAGGARLQTSGFVIHRSVFEQVGFFDRNLRVCQDRDLWWRIGMRHPELAYTPESLYRFYLDTLGSLTKGSPDRNVELQNVIDNLSRARGISDDTFSAFYPVARQLIFDYVLRAYGRQATIGRDLVDRATHEIELTFNERLLLGLLRALPERMARKAADHLRN